MDRLAQDLRFALRQLVKQRGFAFVVIVTLGLAVGVNTLIFSFVNFFVLRPLPFGDVSRTTIITATHPERDRDRMPASYADFVEWRRDNHSFEDLAGYERRTFNLTGTGEPQRVQGALATASLFALWNLEAVHGRVLLPDDDRRGAPRTVLLAHGFWSRQFASDAGILGRALFLDGEPHVVVGVLTPRIEVGTLGEIDVWTALAPVGDPDDREARVLRVTGRLKPGVALAQAQSELTALTTRQEREHPATNARWSARITPIRRAMSGADTWTVLALLVVAVGLVLAIACANVANLVLARGAARRRETAVRAALGASRARLVVQFLTEGAVLSVLGGALGVALASLGLDAIHAVTFEPFFRLVTIDRRVLAFSAAISLATPLVFGLVPALQAAGRDVVGALKDAGGGAVGVSLRRARGRNWLVAGQLALALALLLVAGLAVRMALHFQRLQFGFEQRGLLTLRAELPPKRYASDAQVRAFYTQLRERLAGLPSVTGVALGTRRPVLEPLPTLALEVEGAPPAAKEALPWAAREVASEGYFETLRIPIVKGRSFAAQDGPGAEPVTVVNRALADRYFPGTEPIGKRVRLGAADAPWLTIVGVAGDVMNAEPREPSVPQAYVSFSQQPARAITLLVRTSSLDAVVAAARREVAALDPDQPLYDVKTLERAFFEDLASNRVVTGMFAVFAAVALGLACVGLYGLISYAVSQRTREIGVRVALGARRQDILRLVLGQGLRLVAAGLAAGLLLGVGLARVMSSILVGVSATDPVTFVALPLLLGLVGLLATAIPARRAAGYDPAAVLRAE
jgi:putative ABC transport system permease protein